MPFHEAVELCIREAKEDNVLPDGFQKMIKEPLKDFVAQRVKNLRRSAALHRMKTKRSEFQRSSREGSNV